MSNKKILGTLILVALAISSPLLPLNQASAAEPANAGLSLQVSPSPIIITAKPGEQTSADLDIYNGGLTTENLRLDLQSFKADSSTGRVTLQPKTPLEVASWVQFSRPTFAIKAGERLHETVTIAVPPTAGFSYGFAVVISRQAAPKVVSGQTAIQGSIAVFTLLNIDRPGATKSLQIAGITSDRAVYEYLPATFKLRLKNNGNSLLLPAGNVYIQRQVSSNKPISVLPINANALYLLPGVTRQYLINWSDGVPSYVNDQPAANVAAGRHLEWHWRDSQFRIGRYVARVVVIYNNGTRDVPLETQVSFWVFPWKIVLGLLVAVAILIIGLAATVKFMIRQGRRYQHGRHRRD